MKEKNPQLLRTEYDDPIDEFDVVVSSTECTGLIPTPPTSDFEAESYTDIYAIPQPENENNNGLQHE